ncbi:ATP-grasp domain-containing protein [Pengzhenrongella sicca]|uniref:ATP-grasp domain-containing protein n=1 Tax=Pengzhenrongella sicca TaxID=2819238 RepID=A0A8A4ZDB6_9MICO|nr:hypothetical protein [Pengzhenrongella sicca]QTE29019.1 hypothetical protein J4E96_17185 [Pengzhenrongella sicca]
MSKVLLLVDYRGAFWSAYRNIATLCSLDVERIAAELTARGCDVQVQGFADLDLARDDLEGTFVLYTSSEDIGAHYKRYIEAQVIGLRLAGALPIPEPELLLAHHDKVMMEVVRQARLGDAPGQLASRSFGTLEDFRAALDELPARPTVLKPASGAGSRGVTLVTGRRESLRAARRLTRSVRPRELLSEVARRVARPGYVPRSLHRRPIVAQQFLPGLVGDHKVLRYGERYYVIRRANRPNDFRASGGGRLDFTPVPAVDVDLLDAAQQWSDALGSPFCSLDIAYDPAHGIAPHLLEFQCVNFGPGAAEFSSGHYRAGSDGWERVSESCNLERVFAEAAAGHIAQLASAPDRA